MENRSRKRLADPRAGGKKKKKKILTCAGARKTGLRKRERETPRATGKGSDGKELYL